MDRPIATGLWSRYGKVIHAPDWWLDGLPVGPTLDLELWAGRGSFQEMRSTVGSLGKGEGWKKVKGHALDSPGWHAVLADGELTGPNWKGILHRGMLQWVGMRVEKLGLPEIHMGFGQPTECFGEQSGLSRLWIAQLQGMAEATRHMAMIEPPTWVPHKQTRLPMDLAEARKIVDDELHRVTQAGGEGLVLRSPTMAWVPKRVAWVLKVKKLQDAEATVTGFTWGRRTDLGSKHLGRMGALVTEFRGKRLELSGFTDEERAVVPVGPNTSHVTVEDRSIPDESLVLEGRDASPRWAPKHFPIGSQVTFTYRELTDDGVPREARFLRKRTVE